MTKTVTKAQGTGFQSEISDGHTLLELAQGWLKQGNAVVAAELLKSAIESNEAEHDRKLRAAILRETGRAYMMLSDWEHSEPFYVEAQRLSIETDDLHGAAQCARNRANMLFQRGQFGESEQLCEKALEWATTLNNHELRATILNTLAAIKSATGELQEASKTFRLCLADFRASGNKVRQGYVLLNIGLTQIELGQLSEAVEHLNEALSIALTEKDLHLVEICYQNIAKCYLENREVNLARSVVETARRILPGLNSSALEAELGLLDARVARAMGDSETAEALLAETYKKAAANQMSSLQADVLMEWGQYLKEIGREVLAVAKLNAAAQQYRQIGADKGFQEAIQEIEYLKMKVA